MDLKMRMTIMMKIELKKQIDKMAVLSQNLDNSENNNGGLYYVYDSTVNPVSDFL